MTIAISKKANERSTFGVRVTFTDELGESLSPTSIMWTLTDSAGTVINGRSSVVIAPAAEITIVLSGDDLPIGGGLSTGRLITIEAIYSSTLGLNLPYKEQISFNVSDLVAIVTPTITP
jgi:hypothetical protein